MRFPASKTAVLHRNVEHRAACLALYRRLLKHAKDVNIETVDMSGGHGSQTSIRTIQTRVKSVISKEFKKFSRHEVKASKIREALKFGYKAEHCLRQNAKTVPDPLEQARLAMFLSLYGSAGPSPLLRMQSSKITELPKPKERVKRHPRNPDIALLPPELRHGASLMAGNSLPFIRYSGTKQNASLSGTLNSKFQQKRRREERLELLKSYAEQAEAEDHLEASLRAAADDEWKMENPVDKVSWAMETKQAVRNLEDALFQENVAAWQRTEELVKTLDERKRLIKEKLKEIKMQRQAEGTASISSDSKDE